MSQRDPIVVRHLEKVYRGGRGIHGLDFAVNEGEIFGFLGPNGAGKTTTIRTLMGLLRPTGGSAQVFGFDCWHQAAEAKSRIGFVSADPRLYERMTGAAFLEYMAGFRGSNVLVNGRKLAAEFDLDLRPQIRQLSRGNRQKLLLVQALMHDPPLLVLDEPSGGLDPLGQQAFMSRLIEERSRGKTVFLSSHNLAEVEQLADRVGIIREGQMVAVEEVGGLRARRMRRMDVQLQAPPGDGFLEGLQGVRILASRNDGTQLELAVQGSPGELLGRLASTNVLDLVYPPPDLESVFLGYYGDDEKGGGQR